MTKLILHPNEILNEVMPAYDFDNPIIPPIDLENQLIETMVESNGIGLSANQIGIKTRVFAIKVRNHNEIILPFAVFNPTVIEVSKSMSLDYEGCLSFPNLFFKVNRPEAILAGFLDRDKKEHKIELYGIDARCFLHELDHLNGICYTDRVSKLKLDLAIKKQRKRNGRTK